MLPRPNVNSKRRRALLSQTLLLLTVTIVALMAGCGGDDGPTNPLPPAKILVLEDGGTEVHVAGVLKAAGFEVTLGGNWWETTAEDVMNYDAVFLLTGVNYSHEMSQEAQNRLVTYVANGGGIMTTDWMLRYRGSRNSTICDVFPVIVTRDYEYEPETYTKIANHPLTAGLPDQFLPGPDWTSIEFLPDTLAFKNPTAIFSGSLYASPVITGDYGKGRTLAWGMAGEYNGSDVWTPEVDQLLVNMASWLAGR